MEDVNGDFATRRGFLLLCAFSDLWKEFPQEVWCWVLVQAITMKVILSKDVMLCILADRCLCIDNFMGLGGHFVSKWNVSLHQFGWMNASRQSRPSPPSSSEWFFDKLFWVHCEGLAPSGRPVRVRLEIDKNFSCSNVARFINRGLTGFCVFRFASFFFYIRFERQIFLDISMSWLFCIGIFDWVRSCFQSCPSSSSLPRLFGQLSPNLAHRLLGSTLPPFQQKGSLKPVGPLGGSHWFNHVSAPILLQQKRPFFSVFAADFPGVRVIIWVGFRVRIRVRVWIWPVGILLA